MWSWKSEVIVNREGAWVGNRLRFATAEEARNYVSDLAKRWTMVTDTRVVCCDNPVSHRYIDNQLLAVVPLLMPQRQRGDSEDEHGRLPA